MKNRRGFTIIELLVVISIISLLIAILLPSLAGVRERARYVKWKAYSAGLRIDPSFTAYYNFEEQGVSSAKATKLWNRAVGDPLRQAKLDLEPRDLDGTQYKWDGATSLNNVARNAATEETTTLWNNRGRWRGKDCVEFTNASQFIKVEDNDQFDLVTQNGQIGTPDCTVGVWIRVDAWVSAWQPFIAQNGEPNGWQLRRNGGNNVVDWTTRGTANGWPGNGDFAGNTQLDISGTSQWQLVIGTYDATANLKRIFVNGKAETATQANTNPVATRITATSGDPFTIGCRYNGSYQSFCDGKMDECFITDGSFDATQALEMYQVGAARNR